MSRPPFSPSEAERVAACIGSAVLRRVDHRSAGAAVGRARHRFFQRSIEAGREVALAEVDDLVERELFAATNLEGLDLGSFAAERAFAWNWRTDTARELPAGDGPVIVEEGEIGGRLDVVALVGDDGVFVADWKPEFLFTPPAARFEQLRLGALMAARAYGRDRAVVEVIRPRKDEPPWRDRGELDIWDLAQIAEDMRARAERVLEARAAYANGVEPRLVTGAHCRYCKSIEFCPAQTTLLRRLAGDDQALEDKFFDALSPETASRAWHRLQAAKQLLERLEGALETYAVHNPIDLGDGRVYGLKRQNNLSLNGAAVWQLVNELFGTDKAWDAVEIKATQTKMKVELGKIVAAAGKDEKLAAELWRILGEGGRKAKRLSATAVFDAIVNVLEQRGGARKTWVELVKIHRKGKDDADEAA